VQVPHNFFTHFYLTSVASSLFWGWRQRVWHAQGQMQVVWALMLLQGVRRLLEARAYTSTSKSTMWVAHWILGIFFYLAMNLSIWVEGSVKAPGPWATAVMVPAVLTAHALQHSYHAYLYRLRSADKGYQLPSHTCEIAIYVLLSFLSAPQGQLVNWTVVCGAIFVVSNLGVTAAGTKEWYDEKFGKDKVGARTIMIPFIW
jgi:3-oxo-5-alpha-steroid 4-dehydrogenase 3